MTHQPKSRQSINLVDNPNFRELLIYIGGGTCAEEDVPHRTKFTSEIIEAWKQERKVFADEMKVCLIIAFCIVFEASQRPSIDRTRKDLTHNRRLEHLKSYFVSWCNRPLYHP